MQSISSFAQINLSFPWNFEHRKKNCLEQVPWQKGCFPQLPKRRCFTSKTVKSYKTTLQPQQRNGRWLACSLRNGKSTWRGSPVVAGPAAASVVAMPFWGVPGGFGDWGWTGTAGGLTGDWAAQQCKAVLPIWQLWWASGSGSAAYLGRKFKNIFI